MNKAIKVVALSLVLVILVATLASCGGPSGKYVMTVGSIKTEAVYFEFKGSKVNVHLVALDIEGGKFKIKDDKISITYSDDKGNDATVEYSYEKVDGSTIKIAGVTYTK